MTKARDNATQGGLVLLNSTTISATSTVQINNCFSSTYENYSIVMKTTAAGNSGIYAQLTSGGTANATNYYFNGLYTSDGGGPYRIYSTGQSSFFWGDTGTYDGGLQTLTINSPYLVSKTLMFVNAIAYNTNSYYNISGALHDVSASYDGFKITASSNMTGTIKVYGYK